MPIVRIELCPGRTHEQKSRYVSEVTRLTAEIMKCAPEAVDVIFSEIPGHDWASGGRFFATPANVNDPQS